ncbi:hypothetical protein D3C72_874690 [compost metagenome]
MLLTGDGWQTLHLLRQNLIPAQLAQQSRSTADVMPLAHWRILHAVGVMPCYARLRCDWQSSRLQLLLVKGLIGRLKMRVT